MTCRTIQVVQQLERGRTAMCHSVPSAPAGDWGGASPLRSVIVLFKFWGSIFIDSCIHSESLMPKRP